MPKGTLTMNGGGGGVKWKGNVFRYIMSHQAL